MEISKLGRLTNDPVIRTTSSGKTVGNATFVFDHFSGRKDEKGEWILIPQFLTVTGWGYSAEVLAYLRKGDSLYIEGDYYVESYDKRDGTKGQSQSVTISKITPVYQYKKNEIQSLHGTSIGAIPQQNQSYNQQQYQSQVQQAPIPGVVPQQNSYQQPVNPVTPQPVTPPAPTTQIPPVTPTSNPLNPSDDEVTFDFSTAL